MKLGPDQVVPIQQLARTLLMLERFDECRRVLDAAARQGARLVLQPRAPLRPRVHPGRRRRHEGAARRRRDAHRRLPRHRRSGARRRGRGRLRGQPRRSSPRRRPGRPPTASATTPAAWSPSRRSTKRSRGDRDAAHRDAVRALARQRRSRYDLDGRARRSVCRPHGAGRRARREIPEGIAPGARHRRPRRGRSCRRRSRSPRETPTRALALLDPAAPLRTDHGRLAAVSARSRVPDAARAAPTPSRSSASSSPRAAASRPRSSGRSRACSWRARSAPPGATRKPSPRTASSSPAWAGAGAAASASSPTPTARRRRSSARCPPERARDERRAPRVDAVRPAVLPVARAQPAPAAGAAPAGSTARSNTSRSPSPSGSASRLYFQISHENRAMTRAFVGEWIFSGALFEWPPRSRTSAIWTTSC